MGAFMNLVYEYANYIILAGMLLQMIIILQSSTKAADILPHPTYSRKGSSHILHLR